ncbi:E3 ubiquitin-protein ligase PUB23-like [Carica papaya]|uniref:E3 ubiquitin-protein ligase PUB23-like n=1 Tax=Carica papaya TaxID=3649 RepID=UPI000B8CE1A4|nr:E3 ubiquitin-protein ligase PUB23-like [Carica papaya]
MDQNDDIDVPVHFLCPISLQLMRDPVTVTTGITYDRDNIEKWLFEFNNATCPVTKQSLLDQTLTPNHTLLRLIQSWSTLNSSHGDFVRNNIPAPKPFLHKTQIAKLLADATKFPHLRTRCLKTLISIAVDAQRNQTLLESSGAVVEFLTSVIKSSELYTTEREEALSALHHLRLTESNSVKDILAKDGEFVDSLVLQVMKNGSYQSRGYATMSLKSISEVSDPTRLIATRPELLTEIVRVLQDRISAQASKAALKLMIEICPWGRNRIKAVEAGAVHVLIELLLDETEKRSCELVMMVLCQLCGCADGRAEFLKHGAGLAAVSKKILRVSHLVSDRAVRILSAICRFSGTGRVVQEMLLVGAVSKLCLVLQVEGSLKMKEKTREILKLHSRVWRNSSCIPLHLLSSYPS